MPRLLQDTLPLVVDSPARHVDWQVHGERREVAGGDAQLRLRLQARTALRLTCQRCLQPVTVELDIAPTLRFVQNEALAEQLDEDSEEDVLALPPSLDLRELVEDELILALPLVPRHEHCPQPLPMFAADPDGSPAEPSAFAALAGLLKDAPGKPS